MIFPAAALAQALNVNLGTGAGLTERVVQAGRPDDGVCRWRPVDRDHDHLVRADRGGAVAAAHGAGPAAEPAQRGDHLAEPVPDRPIVMGRPSRSPTRGDQALLDQQMELPAAFDAAGGPVKQFMLSQVDREDLALFIRLSKIPRPPRP
jgi:flagellar biosynthetic protein FliP